MYLLPKYTVVLLLEYLGENVDDLLYSRKRTFQKGWYKQLAVAKKEKVSDSNKYMK